MKSFRGKVAAITGAGSGIGRALALELTKAGASVALSDIHLGNVEETAALVRAAGGQATATEVDVSKQDQVAQWAEATVAHFGKVNLIFNNAGVALSATVEAMDNTDLEWLMGINFWGVVYGTKSFLPHLKAAGDGHIVNISSLFGLICVPGLAAYNCSKFAVRAYTETLRQELDMQACGVSATAVHPGGIKTNIARDARMRDSMKAVVGGDLERSRRNFEKLFTTTAEEAARVILAGVKDNDRRVLIGNDAKSIDRAQRLMPALYQKIVGSLSKRSMAR